MAKSAFESLNRKLEGEDPESNNIDITVVVEADADAAEDIIEAQEGGEAVGEADGIAESEDNSQEQANDMEAMAVVLRQHGMTAGMHAACSVLLPLKELGIVLRGQEDLDAAGKNQADADRLAAALEAAADGFWAGTKKFFADMWEKIKALFRLISTTFGTMKGRVDRARKSLTGRNYDSEAGKDVKFKDVNNTSFNGFAEGVEVAGKKIVSVATQIATLKEYTAVISKDLEAVLAIIGQKPKKESDGDNAQIITGLEPVDKNGEYMKTEEFSVTSDIYKSYSAGGARATGIDKIVMAYQGLSHYNGNIKKTMALREKDADFATKNEETDAGKDSIRAKIARMRSQVAVFYQVITKVNAACKLTANGYIKGCAACRRASKVAA